MDLDQRIATAHVDQAQATAAGDTAKAAYAARLGDELVMLRKEANTRAVQERADEDARARAEQAEVDARGWKQFSRWVGFLGIGAAVFLGGLLGYVASIRVGIAVGSLIGATAAAVQAWGDASPWLLPALGVSVLVGAIYLLVTHVKQKISVASMHDTAQAALGDIHRMVASGAGLDEVSKVKSEASEMLRRLV